MARSHRKTPVFSWCTGTDTKARRNGNKRIRRITKLALHNCDDFEDLSLPTAEELGETEWNWPSDGRGYCDDPTPAMMRK